MNTKLIAAALHALANAIETPESAMVAESASPPASTSASDAPKKRGPGRPPRGEESAAVAATPAGAVAPPASVAATAPVAATDAKLTHAIVANDFKAAAQAHGVAFVKGMLAQFAKGATFDTVPPDLLGKAQAYLKAGPQKAAADPVDDLLG